MANLVITIDGPAASGKSTAARLLADKLGAAFLDTGAMYRAVTLAAMQAGVDMNDEKKLPEVLDNTEFEFEFKNGRMTACIDSADVTESIREPNVTANARYIASSARLRERLVTMQREFAAGHEKIVTEGRDQGTVAFSDADIKFYLTAESAERAKRRQAELLSRGVTENIEQVKKDIEQRDKSDESRAVGPLKPAKDSIIIDTTEMNIEQVVEKLLLCVKEKCLKKN